MNNHYQLLLTTRFHRWTNDELSRVLQRFVDAGWIAHPQWMQANWKHQRRSLAGKTQPASAVDAILKLIPRNTTKARALEVGGADPDWVLYFLLGPWLPGADRIAGIHGLTLELPASTSSKEMETVFEGVARERIAEYAALHDISSRDRLWKVTGRDPAYVSHFFPCLVWCNYLGPTILEYFVPEALTACLPESVSKTWISPHGGPDEGVILVTTPTPEEAASPQGEATLLAMTDCFRALRRTKA